MRNLRFAQLGAAAVLGIAVVTAAASPAMAGVALNLGIGVPGPAYVAPPPVVAYAPPPVVTYAPPPVVTYAPPPVVDAAPPPVVVEPPIFGAFGFFGGRGGWDHHGWHR
jgi:hypothetical protein